VDTKPRDGFDGNDTNSRVVNYATKRRVVLSRYYSQEDRDKLPVVSLILALVAIWNSNGNKHCVTIPPHTERGIQSATKTCLLGEELQNIPCQS
jgi:hypothetical protein